MQPKVSMVMPCYNKVKYIGGMLTSIIAQKWDNIELILVNDGSTDGTREVITEYEQKLKARGYEVVIIDQENMGVAGAVRNGLMRVTGEYVCQVDSDDELDPEYVSAMAGWLAEHPDYEWASCARADRMQCFGQAEECGYSFITKPDCMERYLYNTKDATLSAILYMVRLSYLYKCKIVENFIIEPRISQEPSIVIPLIAGKGKVEYMNKPLYIHNYYAKYHRKENPEIDMFYHIDSRYVQQRKVINKLELTDKETVRYMSLACLSMLREKMSWFCYSKMDIPAELVRQLNKMFYPNPNVSLEQIYSFSVGMLFSAIENCVFHKNIPIGNYRYGNGRVIGYGALGKNGKKYIKVLKGTPLYPDILWDMTAGVNSNLYSILVTQPNLDSVRDDDTVLIFPSTKTHSKDIESKLCERGISNYHTFEKLRDYIAFRCFPELYGDCSFVGDERLILSGHDKG